MPPGRNCQLITGEVAEPALNLESRVNLVHGAARMLAALRVLTTLARPARALIMRPKLLC